MAITIIIDKSTFQSLNFDELYRLSCYYTHIITPVLVLEILGDLKKEYPEGKSPPEERVKDFANKLFPMESIVNMHYKFLVRGDLLGDQITMDGRPIVGTQNTYLSSSGQQGFLVAETEEEKAIYNWKDGKFSEADKQLSSLWRMTTTNEEVTRRLKDTLSTSVSMKIANFNELNELVTTSLNNQAIQQTLLVAFFQNYDINAATAIRILQRWQIEGKPLIKDFAPYAYHCLRIDTFFLFGLASGLIGTRPTNRVDLEYLYYIPFSNIFTSNDKVHKNLIPFLLQSYQKFIAGSELKEDLKNIVVNFS